MGREVRRVPADWQHPQDKKGYFIPLHGRSFKEDLEQWLIGEAKWKEGLREDWRTKGWKPLDEAERKMAWEEWTGEKPDENDYMPDWPESERTHWQMYEDTTEGTPISPVMETPESLAKWMVDNRASAMGSATATYEQWLATIKAGWVPSMAVTSKGVISGVELQGGLNGNTNA